MNNWTDEEWKEYIDWTIEQWIFNEAITDNEDNEDNEERR